MRSGAKEKQYKHCKSSKRFLYLYRIMDEKEKERIRNEKIGEYFLNLSNTVLGAMVLGTLALLFTEESTEQAVGEVLLIVIGCTATIVLAYVGDDYLKR